MLSFYITNRWSPCRSWIVVTIERVNAVIHIIRKSIAANYGAASFDDLASINDLDLYFFLVKILRVPVILTYHTLIHHARLPTAIFMLFHLLFDALRI